MSETPSSNLFIAVAILVGGVLLVAFAGWLVWRTFADRHKARKPSGAHGAMAQEVRNLTSVDTAMLAVESIRARHEEALAALAELPMDASPDGAVKAIRRHLPTTSYKGLNKALVEKWQASAHPPYLAGIAGLAFEHMDRGELSSEVSSLLVTVWMAAPVALLELVSQQMQQRLDRLGPWFLAGGLGDIRRAASLRTDDADILDRLHDGLSDRAGAVAVDFVSWSLERSEAQSDSDPRALAAELVFNCAPLLGAPLELAQTAFARHDADPAWRGAALSLDAMAIHRHADDPALRQQNFDGLRERLRSGLRDHDSNVANAAGHAASDIVEAGYLGDGLSVFMFEEALHDAQNIHWPRTPGQQRLSDLLATLASDRTP